MIKDGVFESGHLLEGKPYIEVDNMIDKLHKLGLNRTVKRKTNNLMRMPVDIDDMASPGGTLKRYTRKISPGQKRFYCRKVGHAQKKLFLTQGFPNAEMSFNQPIGVNKVGVMVKEACETLGLRITGQGLRRIGITTVTNDPGVNVEECLAFARHGSVAAQRPYVVRDGTSEVNRFKAQGLLPKDTEEEVV